jgi:hypothetical protein
MAGVGGEFYPGVYGTRNAKQRSGCYRTQAGTEVTANLGNGVRHVSPVLPRTRARQCGNR